MRTLYFSGGADLDMACLGEDKRLPQDVSLGASAAHSVRADSVKNCISGALRAVRDAGEILEWSWSDLSTWIPMVYLAVTVAAMIYALYQLFGDDLFTFISVLLLVGCGFGAGMVLGFMATIYVSGERVYAPLYGILLAVTLFGICRQRNVWKEPAAVSSAVFLTALTVVCCAVNVLFIVLSL